MAVRKLQYLIYGSRKITIRTDHKPLVDIVSGTAKNQNTAASEKMRCWTADIMAYAPTIEHIKGQHNIITDSLSRLRTDDYHM